MKKFDTSSRNLIKNTVSLIVSALVLLAATFAWFSMTAKVAVSQISSNMMDVFVVDYYAATVPEQDVLWGIKNDELFIKNTSSKVETNLSTYCLGIADNKWTVANGDTINLYPGEFKVFKLSFEASSSKAYSVILQNPTVTADNEEAIENTIYTFGYAVTTTEGTPVVTTATQTLKTTLDADGQVITVNADSSSHVDVYYVIGIPGEDIGTTHDDARLSGATISIGEIIVG